MVRAAGNRVRLMLRQWRFLKSLRDQLLDRGLVIVDQLAPEVRRRLHRGIEVLMDRAREAGQLREDVAKGDLLVALAQLTRPLPGVACPGIDRFVHRHLQLFLDGLRAPARSTLPGSAATIGTLQQVQQND